ncbi:MAG: hypothetical protein AB7L92_03815 [Alphaproteobacteria bacterium]
MKDVEDSQLSQRIAEETGKIRVASYQKAASLGGWAGGGRTLWAISAVGAIAGAAIGLVAPFFPLLVGASSLATAISAIPASVAILAAVGLSSGFGGGLVLGRISGTSAAVAEEQEKRLKTWTAKQLLQKDPDTKIIEDEQDIKRVQAYKPFWENAKGSYETYVNPRVGAFFTVVGAIGGLIMGAAFIASGGAAGVIAPALGAITGLGAAAATAPAVVMATSVGLLAAFGALFSFNLPKVTSELTALTGKFISGEKLGRKWGPVQPEPGLEPSKEQSHAIKNMHSSGHKKPEKTGHNESAKPQGIAHGARKISYREMIIESQDREGDLSRS